MADEAYDYSKDTTPAGDNVLAAIANLAQAAIEAERLLAEAEQTVTERKAALKVIVERSLPDLMVEAGQTECTTANGLKVTLKSVLRASIAGERSEPALKWLEENGHGSIIKHTMIVDIGKGNSDKMVEIAKVIQAQGLPYNVSDKVEPSTLTKLIKDQLGAGVAVPLDTFGAIEMRECVVKVVKK